MMPMVNGAALAAIVVAIVAITPAAAAARRSGPPPFCIDRGGRFGPGSTPLDCRYYDYQTCLQAAADTRGNCVRNINAK